MFFDYFKSFYVSEHHITYSFIKPICSIISRNKISISKFVNNISIKTELSHLKNLKISYNSLIINAFLYKNSSEDIITNAKHVIQQNNLINTNLDIIRKQSTKIEKQIQKTVISPIETIKS
jgi:hypothetical protein